MNDLKLYAQYLAATQAAQRLSMIGLRAQYAMLAVDYDGRGTSGLEVNLSIDYNDADGRWMSDEARESKVNDFIERFPDVQVTREGTYGRPDMLAHWLGPHGISVVINFHSGTCERKQVGTKRVTTYDPEALAALPRVEVEEPIFEYMCPDPISRAGITA